MIVVNVCIVVAVVLVHLLSALTSFLLNLTLGVLLLRVCLVVQILFELNGLLRCGLGRRVWVKTRCGHLRAKVSRRAIVTLRRVASKVRAIILAIIWRYIRLGITVIFLLTHLVVKELASAEEQILNILARLGGCLSPELDVFVLSHKPIGSVFANLPLRF